MEERSDNKVFVGGLAPHSTEYSLAMHFSGYGQILESKIVTDKQTGKSKGFGFVTFANPHAAASAVANPSPFIDGKITNCNLASAPRQPAGAPAAAAATASAQRAAPAPSSQLPAGVRSESYLETLRRQGEDLSPATVEAKVATLYKESPTRALKWFLERAEVFRGTPDLQYYLTNLVALTRDYREHGVIRELPAKGSQEALSIQQEQENKQAQAQAGGVAEEQAEGDGQADSDFNAEEQ